MSLQLPGGVLLNKPSKSLVSHCLWWLEHCNFLKWCEIFVKLSRIIEKFVSVQDAVKDIEEYVWLARR